MSVLCIVVGRGVGTLNTTVRVAFLRASLCCLENISTVPVFCDSLEVVLTGM